MGSVPLVQQYMWCYSRPHHSWQTIHWNDRNLDLGFFILFLSILPSIYVLSTLTSLTSLSSIYSSPLLFPPHLSLNRLSLILLQHKLITSSSSLYFPHPSRGPSETALNHRITGQIVISDQPLATLFWLSPSEPLCDGYKPTNWSIHTTVCSFQSMNKSLQCWSESM